MNVAHDTRYGEVRCILLIEDSVRFYSSYLPLLYTEVLEQTQSLMDEGINLSHRLLRLRARPKILLATSFEEAWDLYSKYKDSLLGVISDGRFPWNGEHRADAGAEFIRRVKCVDPHTPAVLQSTNRDLAATAREVGAGFIHKESRTLLQDLRRFMLENFGFGDFVFRLPDGQEVGRAVDLRELGEMLKVVPIESVRHHAAHDHFSQLAAGAHRVRPGLADPAAQGHRSSATSRSCAATWWRPSSASAAESQRGVVADFSRRNFDGSSTFVRIGGGSLGGKGRGLAFMNSILHRYGITNRFPGTVIVQVPPTAVIGTDVFDGFMRDTGLRDYALGDADDEEITARFLAAKLPPSPSTATSRPSWSRCATRWPCARRACWRTASSSPSPASTPPTCCPTTTPTCACAWTSSATPSSWSTPRPTRGPPRATSRPPATASRRRRWPSSSSRWSASATRPTTTRISRAWPTPATSTPLRT